LKAGAAAGARRYARALLDVALAQADPATVKADLDRLAGLVHDHLELRSFLDHPAVGPEKKKAVVRALRKDRELAPPVQRLVDLLIDRQRTDILAEVARAFTRAWNVHRGVVEAEALSATALDESERRALQSAVERATGRMVELTADVDPSLVGGLLLRMEGRVYDGTVRARLAALRERLAGHRTGPA
jgi:F-type H+-transporting ATPase subunit delta